VPSGTARQNILRLHAVRAGYSCGLALCLFLFGSKALQNAVAEGETRTITMHHVHTGEDITITYKREGRYDEAALDKLNWFLRDWRRGEEIRMDPQLIDLVWEVQRETESKQPIDVICGYRSPATNAMLRRRSRGVARFSQHMLGHAMDFYIPGVPLEELRMLGLRLQRGGVGFYPTSGSPFVHMDTGGVRMWPRMSRNELLRVFPDGRTAYIPSDGRPLPGYELALADIKNRGQNISPLVLADTAQSNVNPLAKLFGFVKPEQQPPEPDEDAEIETASISAPAAAAAHYFPSSSGPAQTAAPAQRIAAAALPPPPAAPAPPAAAPQVDANKAANPLLAALEREAARRRATVGLYAAVPAAAAPAATANNAPAQQPSTYQLASYEETPVGQTPQRLAALTPNQVIMARGYWAGLPDGETAAQPAQQQNNPLRAGVPHPARKDVAAPVANASAARGAAAAESPRTGAHEDRVPPELALAYAAPPDDDSTGAPYSAVTGAAAISRAAASARQAEHLPAPPPGTTIAVKRTAMQAVSTILAAPPHPAAAAIRGARFDSPWLRAVILSPSVRRYLITLLLGDADYRALAALIEKPASSVMMTFAAEPNPGLTADRFSGSAVVFVSTVTYGTHTAALR
jgi:uncharacterized protein YcbK (DUF882 family)